MEGGGGVRAVTKEAFYAAIGGLDVHPQIQPGPHPYTSIWKLRYGGRVVGRSVGRKGDGLTVTDYYLSEGQ